MYDIGLEKYISTEKAADIIAQNHQITLTVDELDKWYRLDKPDYSYFTFTSTNKQLQLYTCRGNSCPLRLVYLVDSVRGDFSKADFDELNDTYKINCSGSDEITIYYGD